MARDGTKIGGSDAAAICGEDPNKTAYSVALRITGKIKSDQLDGLDHIEFGNEIEAVLARFYERKEGCKVYVPKAMTSESAPWAAVNIDRIREDRADIGIEAKNTGFHTKEDWGDPGTDEVPKRVMLQVQHGMMLCPSLKEFHVLRCYGGNTYQKFVVPRRPKMIEDLYEIERIFYQDVMAGKLPEPDWGHSSTNKLITQAFRKIKGDVIEASEEMRSMTEALQVISAERLAAEKSEKALRNRIVFMIGEAGAVRLGNGKMWRRKEIKKDGYTVEPTRYIDTRLVNEK